MGNIQTSEQIKKYNQVKIEIETLTETIKTKSRFSFPALLSQDEQTKREQDAKIETSNNRKKAILKRCRSSADIVELETFRRH